MQPVSGDADPNESIDELLARRLHELEEHAARFEEAMRDLERREELLRDMRASVERQLRLRATDLTSHDAELEETRRELGEREARLQAEEVELTRRRSELGAVELKREALEARERAVEAREAQIEAARAEQASSDVGTPPDEASPPTETSIELLFVPGAAYRIVEAEPRRLERGDGVEVDGVAYFVARIARSPLPQDERLCAYLVRGVRTGSTSAGNS